MRTQNLLVLSLQQSEASKTIEFSHGRSVRGDQVPKSPSSCHLCIDDTNIPAAIIAQPKHAERTKGLMLMRFVPWKKQYPRIRDKTRARRMGIGSEAM
mmetsp:Transcript_119749/g.244905  ORF Transcript_119749/g.244905 Transcript_119749/m.244905 type:complete len:98 (-) Transcript_119749:1063-1356(-)